jgi:tetratricopeptide (TPR) repeat protein
VRSTLAALVLLALAVLAAYHNSFSGPFIFDDTSSIVDNADLRHLTTTLRENPQAGATLVGRPILRMSLWVNYALGDKEVRGYHLLNLVLHTLAAFALWGLVRRILESPRLQVRYGQPAPWLALAISLIWSVHPLQTEFVTYVVQRAEILGGLFYLLTLYGVASSTRADGSRRRLWYCVSVVLCVLGLASKETVATAPLVALAMDRVFFAQSWRSLWRERAGLYLALAGTWALLAILMWASHKRLGSAGFALGMPWWAYAMTQPYYLCRYLALSVWPHALTLDYGTYLAHSVGEVAPYAAIVVLFLALTILTLWRNPPLGFCGLWFFVILAPTSSIVPLVGQTGAEHRMYLPLAGLIAPCVVGGYTLWRWAWREQLGLRWAGSVLALAVGVTALGARTVARNEEYRSEVSIWQTVVDRRPINPRAHYNLGVALGSAGRRPEAIVQYEAALRLEPYYAEAHNNLGEALASTGHTSEAIAHFEEALHLKPDYAKAHYNLGFALGSAGHTPEAIAQYEEALRLKPAFAEAHSNLGIALANTGHTSEAIDHFEQALRLKPDYVEAHVNLGSALAITGHTSEAIAQYEEALRLKPDLAGGRLSAAIAQLEEQLLQQQPHGSGPSGEAGGAP